MLEISNTLFLLAVSGFILGILLGITIVRTRFCTMGAVADIVLSNNYGRMRSWLLAIVIGIIGTQLAVIFEVLSIEQTRYLQPQLFWLAAIVGGLLFGFGMVLSCGCGSRNLAMCASGDLRALVSVIILGIVAYMTIRGIFSIPRDWFYNTAMVDSSAWIAIPSIDGIISKLLFIDDQLARLIAMIVITFPLLWFIFKDHEFRHTPRRVIAGICIGLLMVSGWLLSGWIFKDEFADTIPESLTFVEPVGNSLLYLMVWTGSSINFGIATIGGLVVGSFITALYRKEFNVRGFEDSAEMGRYIIGGALMGMGGALAGGCTFGQGISGISTLSFISILTFASIVIGAFVGLHYIQQGSISSLIKNLWQKAL
jgi:uncharacterized membrane protein YedE/YeeE